MNEQNPVSGTIVGYDPSGKNAHGVAATSLTNGKLESIRIETLNTAEEALSFAK
ncbi:hypothetical protein [Microbulbifer marinus]|uniref:Uncharacterized protein n=1 Tax=Microbulbifer marinus TaxID=658218 RepID=A0A1H3WUL6_9GAMM|nr:hypothetical protein [Microbulbifer marinus]SDZ90845.1 hypothetical protein SAMN05216562_1143 [Microbulbifer marinus]